MAALNQPLADVAADLTGPAAARRPGGLRASQRRRLNAFRYLTFTIFGLFFVLPLLAMVRFSLEGSTPGTWSVAAWTAIASYPGPPPLLSSIEITLELAVITSLVMLLLVVPTMIWIRLRVQWFSRVMEFICLLPLTIPAIVLVVGLAPIYNRIEFRRCMKHDSIHNAASPLRNKCRRAMRSFRIRHPRS
jgi:putative spermidine/putrescine transport system permease protein